MNTTETKEALREYLKILDRPLTLMERESLEYWLSSALTLIEAGEKDKARLDGLRELCWYIEDGEGESISLYHDDATNEWMLYSGRHWWHARSFRGVIDSATAAQQEAQSV